MVAKRGSCLTHGERNSMRFACVRVVTTWKIVEAMDEEEEETNDDEATAVSFGCRTHTRIAATVAFS